MMWLGRLRRLLVVVGAGLLLLAAPDLAPAQSPAGEAPASEEISHDELNKQLNNPVCPRWQAGPAALGLYLGKEWMFGGLLNQWWSFAGQDNRPDTSSMNFQYFLYHLIPGGWQVGMSPNIQVNWKTEPGNKLTLPIGFGAGKLFKLGKLPLKLTLEIDYALVKPEDYGQRWTIRFQMIPVIPALVKDVLFK